MALAAFGFDQLVHIFRITDDGNTAMMKRWMSYRRHDTWTRSDADHDSARLSHLAGVSCMSAHNGFSGDRFYGRTVVAALIVLSTKVQGCLP